MAGACLAGIATPAQAQERAVRFNQPAQPLAAALRDVARTTGLQLIFDDGALKGRMAPPLRGMITPSDAIAILLRGSGFSAKKGRTGVLVIVATEARRAAPPPGRASAQPVVAMNEPLPDIVVTARKRAERAADVPIAVSSRSGRGMEERGTGSVGDAIGDVAGVGIYDQGNGMSKITIRGVSTSLGANENGYYLDDLPFTGVTVPISPDVRAWDLDRVEVLRGPQGTLFGEGSMGGTVRILTKGADLDQWEAKGAAVLSETAGGAPNGGVKGAFNAPIIPGMLGLRVAATHERYDGWVDEAGGVRHNLNDQRFDTFRAKARFDPSSRLSITGSYWFYKGDFPDSGPSTDDGKRSASVVLSSALKYRLYGATVRYSFDGAELFYSYSRNLFSLPQGGTLLGGTVLSTVDIEVDAHELRLASSRSGPLQWTLGGYQRTAQRDDTFGFALFAIDNTGHTRSTARALFGEATYTPQRTPVDLTIGLRYFEDYLRGIETNAGVPTEQPGGHYRSINPRFSIAWRPQLGVMIYASAAKGFRSGQLQPTSSVALARAIGLALPAALKQDSLWTYELGAKAEQADRRLSVEAAIYYTSWKDVAVRVPIGESGFNGLINSPGIRIKGAELAVAAQPARGLTLSASGAYIDAVYARSVPGTGIVDGAPVDDVAKFTANLSADYRVALSAGVVGSARIGWQHSSPRRFVAFPGFLPGDAIDRVDASAGIEFNRLSIALFVDNLADDRGATSFRSVMPISPGGRDDVTAYRLRPRTIGIKAGFSFAGR